MVLLSEEPLIDDMHDVIDIVPTRVVNVSLAQPFCM
jgi:hypothetical protein